jgi:hypothetical protein
MGLVGKPNDPSKASQSSSSSVVELFDVPDSDKPSRRMLYPLKEEEELYIAKCMEKYGDDYTRMFRDIKVNTMQHTVEKLRKMGSRFLLLSPDQRRVEVPGKVLHLLPNDKM